MTIAGASDEKSEQKIEAYLARLRRGLHGIRDAEVREIVEELRSHIIDRAGASGELTPAAVDATLAGLGGPEELASQYLTDNLLARAEVSRSPLRILRSLFRWASLSFAGFFVLLGSTVGYFFGAVFILVAMAKLFHPRTAGLWTYPDKNGEAVLSFRLGFERAPVGAHDVLGWWFVPIGWVTGFAIVLLTTSGAVWCVRQYRKSRVLP
jgi:hypothetical protein